MLPEVASVIRTCLAAAPEFEQLSDKMEAFGFRETGRQGADIRWTHKQGFEVFLSYTASQKICSVWFDGEYEKEVPALTSLLKQDGYLPETHADQFGVAWSIDDSTQMRLVVREENANLGIEIRKLAENLRMIAKRVHKQRLGATLFVQRD
jgi:hypothetical protein